MDTERERNGEKQQDEEDEPEAERGHEQMKRSVQITEAAALLSCSRRTVYRLIEAGDVKAFKIGAALRITLESIEAFRNRAIALYQEENGIEGSVMKNEGIREHETRPRIP